MSEDNKRVTEAQVRRVLARMDDNVARRRVRICAAVIAVIQRIDVFTIAENHAFGIFVITIGGAFHIVFFRQWGTNKSFRT